MKGNTRAEILEAWDNGQKFFWFWNDGADVADWFPLSSITSKRFEINEETFFDNCSIEDPRPKKKTREMTPLEMAWFKGDKVVFTDGRNDWTTGVTFISKHTHYAEILDKGKRLGPWKPLEVEE